MKRIELYAVEFGTKNNNLVLVPYGYYLNKNIKSLAVDSELRAYNAMGDSVHIRLRRKCRIGLNSALGSFLISHIYGDSITLELLRRRWRSACIPLGLGANSFSDDVWLIEYERCVVS